MKPPLLLFLFPVLLILACNSSAPAQKEDKNSIDSCATAVQFDNAKSAEMMVDANYTGELKNYMGDDRSKLDFIHVFERGKLIKSIFYYANGKVQEEYEFKCGAVHGIVKRYYESGKLAQKIPYRYGRLEGLAETFDEEGKTIAEVTFKADSIISKKLFTKEKNQ